MKKIILLVISLFVFGLVLTSCNGFVITQSPSKTDDPVDPADPDEPDEPEEPEEPVVYTIEFLTETEGVELGLEPLYFDKLEDAYLPSFDEINVPGYSVIEMWNYFDGEIYLCVYEENLEFMLQLSPHLELYVDLIPTFTHVKHDVNIEIGKIDSESIENLKSIFLSLEENTLDEYADEDEREVDYVYNLNGTIVNQSIRGGNYFFTAGDTKFVYRHSAVRDFIDGIKSFFSREEVEEVFEDELEEFYDDGEDIIDDYFSDVDEPDIKQQILLNVVGKLFDIGIDFFTGSLVLSSTQINLINLIEEHIEKLEDRVYVNTFKLELIALLDSISLRSVAAGGDPIEYDPEEVGELAEKIIEAEIELLDKLIEKLVAIDYKLEVKLSMASINSIKVIVEFSSKLNDDNERFLFRVTYERESLGYQELEEIDEEEYPEMDEMASQKISEVVSNLIDEVQSFVSYSKDLIKDAIEFIKSQFQVALSSLRKDEE